jgi:hypothetical protein
LICSLLRAFALSRFRDRKQEEERESAKRRKRERREERVTESLYEFASCQKSGLGDPNLALFRCAEIAKKREKSF